MALTLADLRTYVTQVIGTPDANLPPSGGSATTRGDLLVNQAGRYLMKHLWNFRIAPPAILSFVAPISIADGTWTTSSKTLTKTAGFATYTFAKGDIIEISAGTGATTGYYTIASRTSDNAIVLVKDIGATNGSTDIDGEIAFPYVNLPSDFGSLISLHMHSAYSAFHLTDINEVMRRRMTATAVNSATYMAAIVQATNQSATTALGAPRLELDHAPTAADPDVAFVSYYRAWNTLAADADYANVPEFAEDLLFAYIGAFTEGLMNAHADEDGIVPVVTISDRLRDIDEGPLFRLTKEYDGLLQSDYGPTGDGPAGYPVDATSWRSRTSGAVADPA